MSIVQAEIDLLKELPRKARRRRVRALLSAVMFTVLIIGHAQPAASQPAVADHGLTLISEKRLDERQLELTFETDALVSPTKVRVLLPSGYDSAPHRRYPVLFLLHGGTQKFSDWVTYGNAAAVSAPYPVIVVMPDGGSGGYYHDWVNFGAGGPPMYETYHLRQLLPWVDDHLRTVGGRSGRAIAGLSMGGFGSLSYAGRHPDLFAAAAGFSGDVDITAPWEDPDVATASEDPPGVPGQSFGPKVTELIRWRAHNPVDLAPNYRGLHLEIFTGDGRIGGPYPDFEDRQIECFACSNLIEAYVFPGNVNLHNALVAEGIDHDWNYYGPGSHTWNYWERDLKEFLPRLMTVFNAPTAPPVPFTYKAAEPSYEVYGWSVRLDRPAMEFSSLHNVRPEGFAITGSGQAAIISAPWYRPGKPYEVTFAGPYEPFRRATLIADAKGRLHLQSTLGPGNTVQQDSPLSGPQPTYTVQVSISPLNGSGPLGR